MLILTVHALTFAVGLPANVFTVATLLAKIRHRRPRPHLNAADLLLLHLTVADLLLLLFLPFKMAEAAAGMVWPFPTVLCPIANFCFFSSIYLSTLFMAALGVERYFGVVCPHHYCRRRRLWRTAAASAVLWALVLSHCSVVFVAEYHRAFGVSGSEAEEGHSFRVEIGGLGAENPNSVDPVGLKADSSRGFGVSGFKPNGVDPIGLKADGSHGFGVTGFSLGGVGLVKPNGVDPVGLKADGSRGFGVNGFNSGGVGLVKPNNVGPVGLKVDSSRGFGVTGFSLGGVGLLKPNNTVDPNTSTGDVPSPSASKTPHIHISSPKTNLDTPTPESPATTTPNAVHIPTSTPPTPENPTESQPHSAFHCYDDFSSAQLRFILPLRLELCLVLYLLPLAVTVFCYVHLILALLPRPHIPREKKYRTVGLAVATVVNFGVCFAPYNLSHVVGFVQQHSPKWRPYALTLTTLSATLDPFIFYFSSSTVRTAVSGVVGAVRGKICRVWGRCRRRE